MGTVDHYPDAIQAQVGVEVALAELDVAAGGIVDSAGFAETGRVDTHQFLLQLRFPKSKFEIHKSLKQILR